MGHGVSFYCDKYYKLRVFIEVGMPAMGIEGVFIEVSKSKKEVFTEVGMTTMVRGRIFIEICITRGRESFLRTWAMGRDIT